MATNESLDQISKVLGLSDDIKKLLRSVSDSSHTWTLSHETCAPLDGQQKHLTSKSKVQIPAFDNCLRSIQQIEADLISFSQQCSTKLVTHINDVLHIIPETILELVSEIISMRAEHPDNSSSDDQKEPPSPEARFKMLELTYKVSQCAESMLMMQDTTIGSIKINPRQLLEDGLRRELVKRMSKSIQEVLQFANDKMRSANGQSYHVLLADGLLDKLTRLEVITNGFRQSFEYIQDQLLIYGLKIWREELSRIVELDVEQATGVLIDGGCRERSKRASVNSLSSLNQLTKASISGEISLESSFIYRILQVLLKITDPRMTIYDEQMCAWYEQKNSHEKVLDLKVFELIASSLSTTGLNGLDQMCSSMLMLELQRVDTYLLSIAAGKSGQSKNLMECLASVSEINRNLNFSSASIKQSNKVIATALSKITPYSEKIISHLLRIGQLQIIRCNISCVLKTKCRAEARSLYNCLETLNATLLAKIKESSQHKEIETFSKTSKEKNGFVNEASYDKLAETTSRSTADEFHEDNHSLHLEKSQLISKLNSHLEWVGLSDPLSKIYTLALSSSDTSETYIFRQNSTAMDLMFLILLDQSSKFQFSLSINGFVPKQAQSFYESNCTTDGQPLFYGLITLINHYQPHIVLGDESYYDSDEQENPSASCLAKLLNRMSMFVKINIDYISGTGDGSVSSAIRPQDLTLELANMILAMVELARIGRQCSSELLSGTLLPEYIFETFQFTVCHLSNTKGTSLIA